MRLWQKVLFVFLFVWGIIIPVILLVVTNKNDLGGPDNLITGDLNQRSESDKFETPHEKRKILDYNPEVQVGKEEMQYQVKELEDIVLSVRNELRNLEQERTRLLKEVDLGRSSLNKVRRQVGTTKAELQDTKAKLARTLREMKRLNQRSFAEPVKSSVVVVNLEVPSDNKQVIGNAEDDNLRHHSTRKLELSHFDLSRCSLMKPLGVYLVNYHHTNVFDLKHPELVNSFLDVLTRMHMLVDDPDLACIFVTLVGPRKGHLDEALMKANLESLSFWNGGANHIVMNLVYANETADVYSESLDLDGAVYVRSYTHGKRFNGWLLPPVAADVRGVPPPFLPTLRTWLVTFEGKMAGGLSTSDHIIRADGIKNSLQTLYSAISRNTQDRLLINTSCAVSAQAVGRGDNSRQYYTEGEWQLCGTRQDRAAKLSASTFSLVIGSGSGANGPFTYLRLAEALRYGAIPVVIGINRLPLDEVIDWKVAAVFLPPSSLGQLHYILRSLDQDTILKYRRQGRHLWETYFENPYQMMTGVMAVARWKALHPPSPARDYVAPVTFLSRSGDVPPIIANTFQYNFTSYGWKFWNLPPGPAFMYPVTPFKPAPVSGTQYASLSKEQFSSLPGHVVAAGGITGPYFEDFLLGNAPEEHFTIVILTYERNQVLLENIGRLANVDHLAKVLVVWNNPRPPPDSMHWPDIGVALEVFLTFVWVISFIVVVKMFKIVISSCSWMESKNLHY